MFKKNEENQYNLTRFSALTKDIFIGIKYHPARFNQLQLMNRLCDIGFDVFPRDNSSVLTGGCIT